MRCARGRAGSRRRARPAATTRDSSSARFPPASRRWTGRPSPPPRAGCRSAKRSSRRSAASGSCCRRRSRRSRRSSPSSRWPRRWPAAESRRWSRSAEDPPRRATRSSPSCRDGTSFAPAGRMFSVSAARVRDGAGGDPARVGGARGQPDPMTLDGTNTWVLRAPGARARSWSTPVRTTRRTCPRCAAAGSVAEVLLTHGHADHSAGARRFHERTGAPGARPGPATPLRRRGLGRRRRDRSGRRRGAGVGDAGAHVGLAVVRLDRGDAPRGADRRHDPRPRDHRGRASGRRARGLSRLVAPIARTRRRDGAARPRPGTATGPAPPRSSTWPTASSAWTRSATPCTASARTHHPARSSRTSTPTSTTASGPPPNSACRRSCSICGTNAPCGPTARGRG